MTNDEAKFTLSAYRAGGQDATNPHFAPVLEQARRDPTLGRWFELEQALDAATGERLRAVSPPAGLRESILTGAQANRRPVWWRQPAWLAAAAAVVVLLVASGLWRASTSRTLPLDQLIHFAVNDTLVTHHELPMPEPGAASTWLSHPANVLRAGLPMTPAELQADRCRIVRVAGIEVFEICFKRDVWYHIYVARRSDIAATDLNETLFREQGRLATATWSDARFVYVLATEAGLSSLKQLF